MSRAADQTILQYARAERRTLVTLDADFHALLALSNGTTPSVIRIRQEGLRGGDIAELLQRIWSTIQTQIECGAMVTVTEKTVRIRRLPLIP